MDDKYPRNLRPLKICMYAVYMPAQGQVYSQYLKQGPTHLLQDLDTFNFRDFVRRSQ